jgi:hypothetical protein
MLPLMKESFNESLKSNYCDNKLEANAKMWGDNWGIEQTDLTSCQETSNEYGLEIGSMDLMLTRPNTVNKNDQWAGVLAEIITPPLFQPRFHHTDKMSPMSFSFSG